MSTQEAVEKMRAQLGFEGKLNTETAGAEVVEIAEADPLESILTKEQRDFLRDYKAKLESDPKILQLRQDLVSAAIEKERKNMGFPAIT